MWAHRKFCRKPPYSTPSWLLGFLPDLTVSLSALVFILLWCSGTMLPRLFSSRSSGYGMLTISPQLKAEVQVLQLLAPASLPAFRLLHGAQIPISSPLQVRMFRRAVLSSTLGAVGVGPRVSAAALWGRMVYASY